MSVALIIFVRTPVAGKVKTRLALSIGNEAALDVYTKLLEHTLHTLQQIKADKFVYYADPFHEEDMWSTMHAFRFVQQGADLGERLQHACSKVAQLGYEKIIILGSDCPEISPQIIGQAVLILQHHDVCIGPASDGGYYLFGFKKYHADFFRNISWSTHEVCKQACEQVTQVGLTYDMLPRLSDIDTAEDLLHFPEFNIR
jgi:rSAM/selenodomain-associated transferase 1